MTSMRAGFRLPSSFFRSAAILAVAAWCATAGAQEVISVRKGVFAKKALDLSGFRVGASPAAAVVRQVLETDLKRSGWFEVVPAGGAFAVTGTCDARGGLQAHCQAFDAATQANLMLKSYEEAADHPRALAHRIADDIVLALTRYPGVASTRIVFVQASGGGKELFVCDADGQNARQITQDRSISLGPHWSPTGEFLAYTSFRGGFPDAYIIRLDTGVRDRIASFSGMNTAGGVSPDGRDVAVTLSKDGNPEMYAVNVATRRATRLTNTAPAGEASGSWSPDGSRIVFVSDTSGKPQLYIMSRGGGERTRIVAPGSENVSPDWGPNGLIAYTSRRGGQYVICVFDPSSGSNNALNTGGGDWEDPSWARDGRHIACTRTAGYVKNVYILDIMGDNPIPLRAASQGNSYSPAWSPK